MDIVLMDLKKTYGEKIVFDHLNCTFCEGKVTGILGKSGCGKTSLLRILMQLEAIDGGEIHGMQGKKCSAVFQEDRLLVHLTSVANVKLVCKPSLSIDIIKEYLIMMGLESALNQPVSILSGGMKRRVAVLRALLSEYDILIMDEPLKGLDDETKLQVIDIIKNLSVGKTVIMVTHEKEEVQLLDGEIYYMDEMV